MNKTVKKKWLKALRSGKYTQAKHQLKSGDGYCCLGVLTDLYYQAHKQAFSNRIANESYPPQYVIDWAGLDDKNPRVKYLGGCSSLSYLNDNENQSFKQIALRIERYL